VREGVCGGLERKRRYKVDGQSAETKGRAKGSRADLSEESRLWLASELAIRSSVVAEDEALEEISDAEKRQYSHSVLKPRKSERSARTDWQSRRNEGGGYHVPSCRRW
jgi:hypothetical protein